MKCYSPFFSTLYDESGPVPYTELGRGTHYSVLRAVLWLRRSPAHPSSLPRYSGYTGLDRSNDVPSPFVPVFHDVCVLWDEDHDERVIWALEQLYVNRLLSSVRFVGERKGGLTVLTAEPPSKDFCTEVDDIAQHRIPPGDCWSGHADVVGGDSSIINDTGERVDRYLQGIDALWRLGSKNVEFTTNAFGTSLSRSPSGA